MPARTLSAKEVATELGTDARSLRKFLRSEAKSKGGVIGVDTPGKGKRYAILASKVKAMKPRFAAWAEAQAKIRAEAKAAREAAEADNPPEDEEVLEEEVDEEVA